MQRSSSSSQTTVLPDNGVADNGDVLIQHHQQYHPTSVQSLVKEEIEQYYRQRQMLEVAGTAVEMGVGERVQLRAWGGMK